MTTMQTEPAFFERIQGALLEKQRNLTAWLRETPGRRWQEAPGPVAHRAVQGELQTVSEALKKAREHTLGICEVCSEPVEPALLEMDYTSCVCLSHIQGEARRMLEADLELAQIVQRALLPQEVPPIPGMGVA